MVNTVMKPRVVSRAEWEAARQDLLVQEEATRAPDALAAERRRLPQTPRYRWWQLHDEY
jgi:predicted dithiol-disulfide oxidoreductase (DUF899 family)